MPQDRVARPGVARVALWSQVALLAYLELIEWVDLFPFNDVRGGNGQETLDLLLGAVMALAIVATARGWRWVMAGASALYALWLWLQIDSWWIPYLRGASPQWKRVYGRFFGETVKLLPVRGDHLPPDAAHLLLHALILLALVATAADVARRFRRREGA